MENKWGMQVRGGQPTCCLQHGPRSSGAGSTWASRRRLLRRCYPSAGPHSAVQKVRRAMLASWRLQRSVLVARLFAAQTVQE